MLLWDCCNKNCSDLGTIATAKGNSRYIDNHFLVNVFNIMINMFLSQVQVNIIIDGLKAKVKLTYQTMDGFAAWYVMFATCNRPKGH